MFVVSSCTKFIDEHNLLSNSQWGFRAGRSTTAWFADLDGGHDMRYIFLLQEGI